MNAFATAGFATLVSLVAFACAPGGSQQLQVAVLADEMRFEPAEISIPAGQPVRLVLRNQGALVHDFSVAAPGFTSSKSHVGGVGHSDGAAISVHAQPKRDATIEFVASQPGTYEYYCAEPGHKEAGMKGTITVDERL